MSGRGMPEPRGSGGPEPRARAAIQALSNVGEYMLQQRARDSYTSEGLEDSIGMYRQLLELAVREGDPAKETDARFWYGTSLHGAGRLVEAVSAMAPALDDESFAGARVLRNRLLTRYLLVCVDMPMPLDQLEPAMDQVAQVSRAWGWEGTESRVAHARGRLAYYRGHGKEAMKWSRLALNRRLVDPSAYAPHTYLQQFMRACRLAGRIDLLAEVLDTGDGFSNGLFRTTRRIVICLAKAAVSLHRGNVEGALMLTRQAEECAWMTQDIVYRHHALVGRVGTLLAAGHCEEARTILPHLLRRRNAEVSYDAFEIRMLLGDYHVVAARNLMAGGTAAAVTHHLDAAERVYGGARRLGMVVDARLRCHGMRNQANRGLREVKLLRG